MSIDIYSEIARRAVIGLNAVGKYATDRAKFHAPVRHIFDGRKIRNPRGKAFKGHARNWTAADYKAFMKSKRKDRKIQVPGEPAVYGNVASLRPVFRFRNPERRSSIVTMSGDFRQYDEGTGQLARVPSILQRSKTARAEEINQPGSANRFLSSRGRYEVRNARAGRRTTVDAATGKVTVEYGRGALFQGRIGGRLRGEIFQKPARLTARAGTIWTYIVSPTPYAIHQEYGTSHHRAQPFLRPALYESRSQLRGVMNKRGPSPMMASALQLGRPGGKG